MTAGEATAALARWKAAVESRGLGWPTDGDLLELMVAGRDLENARLRRELMSAFEKHAPLTVKAIAGPYIEKVERIFDAKELR